MDDVVLPSRFRTEGRPGTGYIDSRPPEGPYYYKGGEELGPDEWTI